MFFEGKSGIGGWDIEFSIYNFKSVEKNATADTRVQERA